MSRLCDKNDGIRMESQYWHEYLSVVDGEQ